MEVEIRRGKYPTDWTIGIADDGWEPAATEAAAGMRPHLGELYGTLWGWYGVELADQTAASRLEVMNASLDNASARIDAGSPISVRGPESMSGDDVKELLGEFLDLSHWLASSAMESLARADYRKASASFGLSVGWLARFHTSLTFMVELQCEPDPHTPARALSFRQDQLLKPGFVEFCRCLVDTGRAGEIRQLRDLKNIEGYDPQLDSISARTQKAWAREGGITFYPGRKKYA